MSETKFVKTKKERNYTVLDNTFIQDANLSWKAKGLMAYLLSLPDDWVIHFSEIEKHSTDGKAALRSAINELKEHGYLKAEQKRENNRFAEMVYIIIENPAENEKSPFTDFQETEKQETEKLNSENRTLQNTNTNKVLKKQNTDNIYSAKPKPNQETTTKQKRFIKPTVLEISSYCSERKNNIDAQYFYDYYESKGWLVGKSGMKDWKACIRTWERKQKDYSKPQRSDWSGQATDEEYRAGASNLDTIGF